MFRINFSNLLVDKEDFEKESIFTIKFIDVVEKGRYAIGSNEELVGFLEHFGKKVYLISHEITRWVRVDTEAHGVIKEFIYSYKQDRPSEIESISIVVDFTEFKDELLTHLKEGYIGVCLCSLFLHHHSVIPYRVEDMAAEREDDAPYKDFNDKDGNFIPGIFLSAVLKKREESNSESIKFKDTTHRQTY
jgi:hypothetical protein